MFKRLTIFFLSLFIIAQYAESQNYPKDYFRSPLDIPIYLSGTFGELRSNHFHAGIDIKTQGKQGKKIYAIADGYVSRIKVSTSGYGKAIYITHPNGFVSVYGHLQKFSPEIQKYIIALQYKNESFQVESFPDKEKFKVKKGDVIAISGNTGGSMGPHLHFEIREAASQYPINPLLFQSIKIKDYTRPLIKGLAIYPTDETSTVNGKNDTVYIPVEGWGIKHRLKNNPQIKVSGNISFGLRSYDMMNEIFNKNGVYSVELKIDSVKSFGLKMNQLSFSTTRYINSLIDYGFYIENSLRYIRTCIDTNNRLFVYDEVINNGIYAFNDSLSHEIEFTVKDAYDNVSKLKFNLQSVDTVVEKKNLIQEGKHLLFSKEYELDYGDVFLSFPANTFYRSLNFMFDTINSESDNSLVYIVHNNKVAVQKYFTIKIKPPLTFNCPEDKLYIAYSPDNEEYFYMGNKYNDDVIIAKSRSLGYYTIKADTVKPIINTININKSKKLDNQLSIKMTIEDKETGIKSYNAYLNGNWILMEYDAKNNLLTYNFDDKLKKGKNTFKLVVEDLLLNKSVFQEELLF